MVFLIWVNSGQGRERNYIKKKSSKAQQQVGKTWRVPDICLGIEDIALFANETVWAVQNPPFIQKAAHKQRVFSCHCPHHRAVMASDRHSPPCFSLSSIFERNSRGKKKKWWWGRLFLGTLSQINVDGLTQTSSLWDPDIFLGLIFLSCNP